MLVQCTKCKRKFHKKVKEIPYIETNPYCTECYEGEVYFRKLKRNVEKDKKIK